MTPDTVTVTPLSGDPDTFSAHYAVYAVVFRETPDGTSVRTLPTFYLHAAVQGITGDKHAAKIAAEIIRDAAGPDADFRINVFRVSP